MGKILFHQAVTEACASPFDESIYKSAKDSDVKIVSPYLGMNYIGRIISVANSWRLITDANAWLQSISKSERGKALHFLRLNDEKIRHCDMLHAKAAIGEKFAYFGSANLTETGVLQRTELGIFIEEPEKLQELHNWFDSIWNASSSLDLEEVTHLSRWLDEAQERIAIPVSPKVSRSGIKVNATYYAEPSLSAVDIRPAVITPGVPVRSDSGPRGSALEYGSSGKESPPAVPKKSINVIKKNSQENELNSTLDFLCFEVLKLVEKFGNPMPLHTPWSVLEHVSKKTKIPWAQVSKALTQPKENGVFLIDIRQVGPGCFINLEALTPSVIGYLPRTAAAWQALEKTSL